MALILVFIVEVLLCFITGAHSQFDAICNMAPNSDLPNGPNVEGTVQFNIVENENVEVTISLQGFNTTDDITAHGFHIHELGDLSEGCTSTGGHFNPENVDHAGRLNETRHVGDLGNIYEDINGNINDQFVDEVIKLNGGDNDIMGRAVVVHETMDDLGVSGDPAGAAGARLACCVITSGASIFSQNSVVTAAALLSIRMMLSK